MIIANNLFILFLLLIILLNALLLKPCVTLKKKINLFCLTQDFKIDAFKGQN
jgi:hypothetical protein